MVRPTTINKKYYWDTAECGALRHRGQAPDSFSKIATHVTGLSLAPIHGVLASCMCSEYAPRRRRPRGYSAAEWRVAIPSLWPRPGGVLQQHGLGVHRSKFCPSCSAPLRGAMPTLCLAADPSVSPAGFSPLSARQPTFLSLTSRPRSSSKEHFLHLPGMLSKGGKQ